MLAFKHDRRQFRIYRIEVQFRETVGTGWLWCDLPCIKQPVERLAYLGWPEERNWPNAPSGRLADDFGFLE